MGATLRIITSGLSAQQRNIDIIANNIANLHTTGFKKSRVEFKDLPYRPEALVAAETEQPELVEALEGEGVRVNATQLILSQGALEETGRALDLALDGPGFFQVQLRDGTTAYTRDGGFALDARNRIVNRDGFLLSPNVVVPEDAVALQVEPDGTVRVQLSSGEDQELGTLTIARFPNPEGLASIGHNLFAPTEASGVAAVGAPGDPGYGELRSGTLERGNVDLSDEVTRLMQAQRAYQLGLEALRAWDQIAAQAANIRA